LPLFFDLLLIFCFVPSAWSSSSRF